MRFTPEWTESPHSERNNRETFPRTICGVARRRYVQVRPVDAAMSLAWPKPFLGPREKPAREDRQLGHLAGPALLVVGVGKHHRAGYPAGFLFAQDHSVSAPRS